MTSTRLSDDEIVAIAVAEGGAWMGPLPTVDEQSADALRSAALRGARNLNLRLAQTVGAGDSSLDLTLVSRSVGQLPTILGYVADEQDLMVPNGISFTVFDSGGDDWLLVVTTPDGINEAQALGSGPVLAFLNGLVTEGLRSLERPGRAVALFAPEGPEAGRAVAATSQRVVGVAYRDAPPDFDDGDDIASFESLIRDWLVKERSA